MPLLLLLIQTACLSPEIGLSKHTIGCPTVAPESLTVSQEELGMPIQEALVVQGDTVLTSAAWLPEEGDADAVEIADISSLEVVGEAWIGLVIHPGELPLSGRIVLTTHDPCELITLIQTE